MHADDAYGRSILRIKTRRDCSAVWVQDDVGPARYVEGGHNQNDSSRARAKLRIHWGGTNEASLGSGIVTDGEVAFTFKGIDD